MIERCRKKRGSLTRFPFQSSGIRVHNDPNRAPTPFPSPGVTYSAFIAQSHPVLRPFDRSISRPSGAVHRPTSLLSTEPIDHKSGIGVVRVPFPVHPPPQFVFGFGERLPRLPQSCKYDGAPSAQSRGAERVSMAHLVSIRVLLFCAPLMTVSNIRLIPLSPIGLGTDSLFCRIFIEL